MHLENDHDSIQLPTELAGFFILLKHRLNDPRWRSILVLLAEHEEDQSPEEQANIRRTIDEILADKPLDLPDDDDEGGDDPIPPPLPTGTTHGRSGHDSEDLTRES